MGGAYEDFLGVTSVSLELRPGHVKFCMKSMQRL